MGRIMTRMLISITLFVTLLTSACRASELAAEFMAGDTCIEGGVSYQKDAAGEFWKIGGFGLYTNYDALEYKWIGLDNTVGSDTLYPGLTWEVGFTGISGDAQDDDLSSDVGAMAFSGKIGYVFPDDLTPIPLKTFARITYAPESICFVDTKGFLSYHLGMELRIARHASVLLKYSVYDVDVASASHAWNLKDNRVQLGIMFRF